MVAKRSRRLSERSTSENTSSRPRLTSLQVKRLRDALEKRAIETIEKAHGEALPPWRRRPRASVSPDLREPNVAAHPSTVNKHSRETKRMVSPRTDRAPKVNSSAFDYWGFPKEATVRESPPTHISDSDRSLFRQLLESSTASSTSEGESLFVFLGLDFGTSSTKIIVRLPFEPGEPTIAIPAPVPCRSGDDPYLWQTVLWLDSIGVFSPWPERNSTILHSLKQGLLQGRSPMTISDHERSLPVNRSQAAVAYLAFVIRYAKGWLLHNRPNLFRRRDPIWLVNLGMPTASYDDPEIAKPYRCVGAAALLLAKSNTAVTVESTRNALDNSDVNRAGTSDEIDNALAVTVIPEAAAEMTGFAKSTRGAPGLYLLIDVGAMTLDTCMFRLNRSAQEADVYAFMAAQVRPLGVDSLHWFLGEGKSEPDFIQQCNRTLMDVIWTTKQRRDPAAEVWRPGNDVPVFFAGGGSANSLHQNVVTSLGASLTKLTGNDGFRLLELPIPGSIELPEPLRDFGRMAVAWGLSYPPMDIGEIQPMREIADIPPRTVADMSDRYISKDQV